MGAPLFWNGLGTGPQTEKRIILLEQIRKHGSITRAAKAAGMSYKAAWDAINAMNNLSERPLVISSAGGREGGGTHLTDAGEEVVGMFRAIEGEYERIFSSMEERFANYNEFSNFMRRLSMRISARNIISGTISSVDKGMVMAIVKVRLKSGNIVSSIITNESVDNLGLKPGISAYAIVKASSVMIGKNEAGLRLSARNILKGRILTIKEGMVMAEVTLDMGNGDTVSATISDESTKNLGLKVGEEAVAVFKATSAMIGVD